MSLLASSQEPTKHLVPDSKTKQDILSLVPTALHNSIWLASAFHRLLSITSLFVFMRAYLFSLLVLKQSFYAIEVVVIQSVYAWGIVLKQLWWTMKGGFWLGWNKTEKIRRRVAWETGAFLLGGGNGLMLVVLWPGWILVGISIWVVWFTCM